VASQLGLPCLEPVLVDGAGVRGRERDDERCVGALAEGAAHGVVGGALLGPGRGDGAGRHAEFHLSGRDREGAEPEDDEHHRHDRPVGDGGDPPLCCASEP